MKIRGVKKAFKSIPTMEGAGVNLRRAFGFHQTPLFDPFLLLDDFRSNDPTQYSAGFPRHPHRGIETITYVLAGSVAHEDSLGNKGTIQGGDVQWMTAGSGIIHQEMPSGDTQNRMHGFQLWANLPASHKMMPPRYRDITEDMIPEVTLPCGGQAKVIAGEIEGTRGPVDDIIIEPNYFDITLKPHCRMTHPFPPDHTVFAYVIDGKGYFCCEKKSFAYETYPSRYSDLDSDPGATDGSLLLFGSGDQVLAFTEDHPLRFLLVSGKPLHEPIAWYGPIVMNTQDELRTAFDEYSQGTFIKDKSGT